MGYFLDRLFHRIPWSGDTIRLYRNTVDPIDRFIGVFDIKMVDGKVFVSGHGYIRGDLPKWSRRFECWEYTYA